MTETTHRARRPAPSGAVQRDRGALPPGDLAATTAVRRPRRAEPPPPPLVWTFDGPLERCLADCDETLRRALVLVGDVRRIALLLDVSLPALAARVRAGDAVQPAWSRFVGRLGGYGIPGAPRIRHLPQAGPLATLVLAYRH